MYDFFPHCSSHNENICVNRPTQLYRDWQVPEAATYTGCQAADGWRPNPIVFGRLQSTRQDPVRGSSRCALRSLSVLLTVQAQVNVDQELNFN